MPIDLVWFGSVLVAGAGVLVFLFIRHHKPAEPQHFGKS
jgi:hypothetical protein